MDPGPADFQEPEMNSLMQRIGGQWAGPHLQKTFQREVAELLGRGRNTSFPGAQPVSFSAEHIQELKSHDYYVCEKTDGLRYLLYLTEDRGKDIHYFIDRRNDYWYVPNLHFPHHEDRTFRRFHTATILDGELVEDKYPGQEPVVKFLVFDCLVLDRVVFMQRPLDKRLAYFQRHVLQPYNAMFKLHPEYTRPFVLEDKINEFSYGVEKMFNEIIPRVKKLHGNDGLIFTAKDAPYVMGTDPHILKWKPPSENTVDFLLHIEWAKMEPDPDDPDQSLQPDFYSFPEKFSLFIHVGSNEYSYIEDMYVKPEEWEEWKNLNHPLQDIIIECYQDELQRWRFHRFRHDKENANHIKVFKSVIKSIQTHVTEEDLINNADEIRTAWKLRDQRRALGRRV